MSFLSLPNLTSDNIQQKNRLSAAQNRVDTENKKPKQIMQIKSPNLNRLSKFTVTRRSLNVKKAKTLSLLSPPKKYIHHIFNDKYLKLK
jgi:hypothetical protein